MQELQETWVQSLGREDPLEKGMATPPVFLTGESTDRGAWRAAVQRFADSDTTENLACILNVV